MLSQQQYGAFKGLGLFSLLVIGLWGFPEWWYRPSSDLASYAWFEESEHIEGWAFEAVPIGKAAESVIHADAMFNGRFENGAETIIHAYSAKRYSEKKNEIGLFSHTPDRCWVNVGWTAERSDPAFITVNLHGIEMILERRIFQAGTQRELVYFGALVGGRPLPYRIDQYYQAALRRSGDVLGDDQGALSRIRQGRVWSWAFESFYQRSRLKGAQQFLRISTPLHGAPDDEDALLQTVLPLWLHPTDFRDELN